MNSNSAGSSPSSPPGAPEFALEFARREDRGGPHPILEHQAVGYALADAKTSIEATRWRTPPAFDVLYWHADSTNLPAGLHADFVDVFNDNRLAQGGFSVLGKPIDLRAVDLDYFVVAGINDHITPWRGAYRTTQLFSGHGKFVLSHAGHIASVVNPPGNPNAHYHMGPEPGPDPDAWLEAAERHSGTWWEVWADWTRTRSGDEVPAPQELGRARHPVLGPAPGKYVLEST